jgi:hypothetical protein
MRACRIGACLCLAALVSWGCSRRPATATAKPVERRFTLWLMPRPAEIPEPSALAAAGTDEVVLDAGQVDMGTGVPVLRLATPPAPPAGVPFGVFLKLRQMPAKGVARLARPVWSALKEGWPAVAKAREILADMAVMPDGSARFLGALAEVSGIPVVPVVTAAQLSEERVQEAVTAAGRCVVLVAGNLAVVRPGVVPSTLPMADQLSPLAGTGVRPRVAIVIVPRARPALDGWPADPEPLTHPRVARLGTSDSFDWRFVLRRSLTWSGRAWKRGDTIEASWMDAVGLDRELAEASALTMPPVGGWDVVGVPPRTSAAGMSLDALLAYFRGEGPVPGIGVHVERSGSRLRVRLENPTPFCSAVSSYGTWVEISVGRGVVAGPARGGFDRVLVGSVRSGTWRPVTTGRADAVRFTDTYVAPGETVRSGWVRLPSRRSRVRVRWRVLLSSGAALTGVAAGS